MKVWDSFDKVPRFKSVIIYGRRMEIVAGPLPMPNGGIYWEVHYKGQYLYVPQALVKEGKTDG